VPAGRLHGALDLALTPGLEDLLETQPAFVSLAQIALDAAAIST
jgi:hypothetical protein